MTLDMYRADRNTQDATCYRLLMIGEAVRKLPGSVTSRYREIAWHEIVGLRNILAHEYAVVDNDRVWTIAMTSLPLLVEVCRRELARCGVAYTPENQ